MVTAENGIVDAGASGTNAVNASEVIEASAGALSTPEDGDVSKTKPKAKRKRTDGDSRPIAITCTPCRLRKVKCDSVKPTCGNCVTAKNTDGCVYPVKQKPGLRPGTGSDTMKRLEQLEQRLRQYESQVQDHEVRIIHLSQQADAAMGMGMRGFSRSMGESAMSAAPPVWSPGTLNASPAGGSGSFVDVQVLPPDDVVRDLISLYFIHIHPWAPIIAPFPASSFTQPWSILIYAIVVVTLRFSEDPRVVPMRSQYHAAAKSHVLSHAIESTSIASVQALALLALDLIGSEQGPSSWGILALLTRSAVHLGLRQEDEGNPGPGLTQPPAASLSRTSIIPPPTTWTEDESRRRLFWLIFCLDRYACVSTGWEFALPDDEIKRRLPCNDAVWAGGEWYTAPLFTPVVEGNTREDLSPMAYLVQALDLLGRAHTLQARTVDGAQVEQRKEMTNSITAAARSWFAQCPVKDWGVNSMGLVIQAIYHATLLKLNAYYAYPALSDGDPVEPYGSTCMQSALALVTLNNQAREVGFKTTSSPLFIWSTWVAARVLFVHAFLSRADGPESNFDLLLSSLDDQASIWSVANQYVKLLQRAKSKWTKAGYDPEINPSLPDAIHVLLDLRRTAYSAVAGAIPGSPPDMDLSHLPAWAVQPLLGGLHNWFDLPAGLFTDPQ